jgi:hypothetical protein
MVRFYALERISKTLGSPNFFLEKQKFFAASTPLGALLVG